MTGHETPPLCCHCGQPMRFLVAQPALPNLEGPAPTPGAWDEHWRCPEGRWTLARTVLAPPGYLPAPPIQRRTKPRRKRAGTH